MNQLILEIKRARTGPLRRVRSAVCFALHPPAPRVPRWVKPALRVLYEFHYFAIATARSAVTALYRHPLFQARCASIGEDVTIDNLPFVSGHVEIEIGNHVRIGGNVSIFSGSVVDRPRLVLKDHAEVNWNVMIAVSREVVIEEYARVSYDCRISDSDGHPREADLRARNLPVDAKDIRPVRIGRYAWIGNGTHIMKGVTIGEGAIVGANSVVIHDIPPYSMAMGNPAEVYFRNAGRPSAGRPAPAAQEAVTR